MSLAENLKTARLNAGMTLNEVADRIGVQHPAVYKWESGIRIPNGIYLVELAEVFNTTAEALVKTNIANIVKEN